MPSSRCVAASGAFLTPQPLYKQRLASTLLAKVLAGYKAAAGSASPALSLDADASAPSQSAFLAALAGVLPHLPRKAALSELPKLMPMLLRALDLPDPRLRAGVADTIATLAPESTDALSEHVARMVPALLRSALEDTSAVRLFVAGYTS